MKIGAACGVSPGHREARVEVYCCGSRSVFRMALLRFRSNASVRPKTSSIASLEFVI